MNQQNSVFAIRIGSKNTSHMLSVQSVHCLWGDCAAFNIVADFFGHLVVLCAGFVVCAMV